MKKEPLISIIIATKNRAIYCEEAVKSILHNIDAYAEVVIQDNSTTDELRLIFSNLNDTRIIYNYSSRPLSIIDNFNAAISLASGKFTCILGDDDTILPTILPIIKWMDLNDIETVCSNSVIDFIWPNAAITAYETGELKIPNYDGNFYTQQNINPLIQLLKKGLLNYQAYNLPRLYHGIVKRELLYNIKAKTGHFLGGLTPDIYATIALSFVSKKHYVVNYPFSIAGACPASASVANLQGKHSGQLKNAPHFINRGNYVWQNEIPKYYSVDTIWAETAITTIKEMGEHTFLRYFNSYAFLVHSIFSNKKHILKLVLSGIIKYQKTSKTSFWVFWTLFGIEFFKILAQKSFKIIKLQFLKPQTPISTYYNITNLNYCVSFVEQKLPPIKF